MRRSHGPTMFLWAIFICLLSTTLVVSEFAQPKLREIDAAATLQPMGGSLENNNPSKVLNRIRNLLRARWDECPQGYEQCSNAQSSVFPFQFVPSFVSYPPFLCDFFAVTIHAIPRTVHSFEVVMLIRSGNYFPQVLPNWRSVLLR